MTVSSFCSLAKEQKEQREQKEIMAFTVSRRDIRSFDGVLRYPFGISKELMSTGILFTQKNQISWHLVSFAKSFRNASRLIRSCLCAYEADG